MSINIIGTESLGVRGMCCLVTSGNHKILIDPGVALGYQRHGLRPHPLQVARGIKVRQEIIRHMASATDIVFSHFHGDHVPLAHANPYQLSLKQIPVLSPGLRVWAMSEEGLSPLMCRRAAKLSERYGARMRTAEGCSEGMLSFSSPVPHGAAESGFGSVMMTCISTDDGIFVHAADIQLLDSGAIEKIIEWNPNILFAAGPPLYLGALTGMMRKQAWENGLRLAMNIDTLIVDHHLMRSTQGLIWLDNLSRAAGKKIYCAADFMNRPRLLLEAERGDLYKASPVPENWHDDYEKGRINVRI